MYLPSDLPIDPGLRVRTLSTALPHIKRRRHVADWHKTSAGDVGSVVGDWMMNGHIAGSPIR
jgi:hypothetical protein